MLYCPACREYFSVDNRFDVQPPYSAVHVVSTGTHLHPITRKELARANDDTR